MSVVMSCFCTHVDMVKSVLGQCHNVGICGCVLPAAPQGKSNMVDGGGIMCCPMLLCQRVGLHPQHYDTTPDLAFAYVTCPGSPSNRLRQI